MKKGLFWYYILHKRLLKKASFITILLLIPLFTFLMTLIANEEAGFVRIALAAEQPQDAEAAQMLDALDEESKIISYTRCDSADDAVTMVKNGDADAAWVLADDFSERLDKAATGESIPLVTIYTVEDNTFVKSSREALFGKIYSELSYRMYEARVENLLGERPSDEELSDRYSIFTDEDGIIEFKLMHFNETNLNNANYLTSPIRGLLCAIMLLCGLAATLYFCRDERAGVFSTLSPDRRILVFLGNNMAALSIAAVFVTLALIVSGNYTGVIPETLMMLLFILMSTGFCTLLGTVLSAPNTLALILPVVLVLTIAFCPVFVNVNSFMPIQVLLPPYYYLYGFHDFSMLWGMVIYVVLSFALSVILYRYKHRNGEARS